MYCTHFFIYHYYVNVSHNKCLDTHMWKNENRVHTFKAIAIIVVLVAPLCLHNNRGEKSHPEFTERRNESHNHKL